MRTASRLLVSTAVIVLLACGSAWAAAPQAVTITMRDFSYTPSRITVQAGVPVEFTFFNKGKLPHEFMIYNMPKSMGMMMGHEWAEQTNYFRGMMNVTATGGRVTREGGNFFELRVAAGQTASLRFTPLRKGTFEFGCMIKGHYEAGQHGTLVVK